MGLAVLFLCLASVILASAEGLGKDWVWAKGGLHTHTSDSDGDSDPQEAVNWYREHGYQFVVISDHWKVTEVADIDVGSAGAFVLIKGEETGVREAKRAIHANSVGADRAVDAPESLGSQAQDVAEIVERIRRVGGIPMVNHPNYDWSFGHRELLQVKDPYLLEVFNGHPSVNSFGNAAFLPVEQTWDILLSGGKTVYAAATDDAHHFREFKPGAANPGRGWVYVRVNEPTPQAILRALAEGDLYASTGVELEDCAFDGRELSVRAVPGREYLIRFVGKWGEILQETVGTCASCRVPDSGPHSYVRCKIIAGDAGVAWTQAYRA